MCHKQKIRIVKVVEPIHHSIVCSIINHFAKFLLILAFQFEIVMTIFTQLSQVGEVKDVCFGLINSLTDVERLFSFFRFAQGTPLPFGQ